MPYFLILSFMAYAGCTAVNIQQAYIDNEDSHPHEIVPGDEARFTIPSSISPQKIAVVCTLSGPVGPIVIKSVNFFPTGWAWKTKTFHIGRTPIKVDVRGVTAGGGGITSYFAFFNQDPTGLLWHQCYNYISD